MKLYEALATALASHANCEANGNLEWAVIWGDRIHKLMEAMPSGSGFDAGTTIDVEKSDLSGLTFLTQYHHMNDAGMYDGWSDHTVTVKPLLTGIDLKVSGRDRNGIKEYIGDTFYQILDEEIPVNLYEL